MGSLVWEDSQLILPKEFGSEQYRNIFTGEIIRAAGYNEHAGLSLAEVFAVFPVAVLEACRSKSNQGRKDPRVVE